MFLSNSSSLGRRLAAAPILQLHGSRRLVSCSELRGKAYVWCSAFGGEAQLKLFSSGSSGSSSSLHFADPSTTAGDGHAVLHNLLGLQLVPMSVLVEELLRQQQWLQQQQQQRRQGGLDAVHSHHEKLLLFLLSNFKHLGDSEQRKLQQRMLLRCDSSKLYVAANCLRLPLSGSSSSSSKVPADLQPDLEQAGLRFLHSSYKQLAAAAAAGSAGDLWQLIKNLGVGEVTTDAAAQKLLQLYLDNSSRRSIRQEQHLRHVNFLTAAEGLSPTTHNGIRNGQLRLYSSCQDPSAESPEARPDALHWPLSGLAAADAAVADAITLQLERGADLKFVHCCYSSSSSSSSGNAGCGYGQLMRAGVKAAGPDVVSSPHGWVVTNTF
jgi:hypothetical protein